MKITKETFEKEVLQSSGTVLVDFYADWCGPCKMLSPVLEELEKDRKDFKLCKINVDEEGDLAGSYGVQSIPTLALIKDGKLIKTTVGFMPKEKVNEFLG